MPWSVSAEGLVQVIGVPLVNFVGICATICCVLALQELGEAQPKLLHQLRSFCGGAVGVLGVIGLVRGLPWWMAAISVGWAVLLRTRGHDFFLVILAGVSIIAGFIWAMSGALVALADLLILAIFPSVVVVAIVGRGGSLESPQSKVGRIVGQGVRAVLNWANRMAPKG